MKESNLIIHIGAPRTGTSFLRSEIFPRLEKVKFVNKQMVKDPSINYFDSLSHYGDGDELSLSLQRLSILNQYGDNEKVLVSEEHLLWSVYHLFGNVGSRALLLKERFPDARILITIRRQPELLLSAYSYLRSLKKPERGNHLKSVWTFVNYAPQIKDLRLKTTSKLPTGIEWTETDSTYDIGLNYFKRSARHFVAADFSWLILYQKYSELFGPKNVLLLPQEIWREDPWHGVFLLEEFIGEKIRHDGVDFNAPVNVGRPYQNANSGTDQRFAQYIQLLVREDNQNLDRTIDYCDFAALGYTERGVLHEKKIDIGFGIGSWTFSDKTINVFTLYRKDIVRTGFFSSTISLVRKSLVMIVNSWNIRQRMYRLITEMRDRLKGLDFERIESVKDLSLDPKFSQQYEGSKIEELDDLFKKIDLPRPIRFMDLGSGKGRVLCYVANLDDVEIVRGIEISERLVNIARRNIAILRCQRCEVINLDVRQLTKDLIDDTNVFYFYNPFPRQVFYEIIKRVYESIILRSTSAVIIYFNPMFGDVIEEMFSDRMRVQVYSNKISNAVTKVYWIN